MSERPPLGWRETKFGELCQRIVNGGTPATDNPRFWNGRTPWVTGADFTSNGIGEIRRFVSDAGVRASATSVVKAGNLLVVTRTGVGKLAVAPFDIAISQDVSGVYVDGDQADTSFVFYLLSRELDELKKLNQGTSINGIIRTDLERYLVRIPSSKATQRKVAAILTSLDTAIEKTESLIGKHQQIKAGLMHDLFTRGVLPNGQLRPLRAQAPDQYVEASMGWIPKCWKVEPLSNRVQVIDPNPSHRYPPPVSDGVPLASTENFLGEGDFQLDGATQVPEETFVAQNERCHFKPMDVVFARKGKIGLARRYGNDRKVFSHTVVILKPSDAQTDAPWLVWAARSAWLLNHIDRTMNSNSGVPTLGVDFIKKVPMPFPPRVEQAAIASQLDKASEVLSATNKELRKLRQQKLGLMQDLLTGKVPVKIADPEAVPA